MRLRRLTLACLLAGLAAPAGAHAAAAPAWAIRSVATPTGFTSADSGRCVNLGRGAPCDAYIVQAVNVGSAPSAGTVTLKDTLPQGVVIAGIGMDDGGCPEIPGATAVTCTYTEPVPPGGAIAIEFEVKTTPRAPALVTNLAEVQGGGAARAVTGPPGTSPNTIDSPTPTPFGVQSFLAGAFTASGAPEDQAAAHPALLSTTIAYNTLLNPDTSARGATSYRAVAEARNTIVSLPRGLAGDPLAAAACPQADLVGVESRPQQCPPGSAVGYAVVDVSGQTPVERLIYNVTPEPGYPAEFAFEFNSADIYLRARLLPTSDGYTLSVSVPDIIRSTNVWVTGVTISFYGDPTEQDGAGDGQAFITNPGDCAAGPLESTLEMDSWVDPGRWVTPAGEHAEGIAQPIGETTLFSTGAGQGVEGCGALRFEPQIQVTPAQSATDTPTGLQVRLTVPQSPNLPGTLATPDLKDAVLTLPQGIALSPSAANGLQACPETGPEGIDLGAHDLPEAQNTVQEGEEMGADGLVHPAAGHCPPASQIGEAEVSTPLLAVPLKGHVYLAQPSCGNTGRPQCTPADAEDGALYGMYLELAGSGVIVKLHGEVSVNPQTGQITTRFTNTPQLPFSELTLTLTDGPRAPLATPQSCGTLNATSDLTPWSTPYTPDATPLSQMSFTGGCSPGFAPGFLAETTSPAAGAYSPFTLTLSRNDGEQDLSGLTVRMPPGLIGRIAGIAECGEAEAAAEAANTGSCPIASRVGTATAAAGAGPDPYWQSGPVYLTGPYNGAPFGLAVVVPANAGPFHLGNIVVRAAIHIDPATAQVTVVSNPLPQMIDGVPLRIKTVNVTVGGEGTPFTFNPTSCNEQSISATVTSAQGTPANVSTPFAAAGCATLPFRPSFSVSAQGHTSKADGASLDVRIATHQGPGQPAGVQEANIRKVDVQLPKDLPSRLSTLQKACTEHQFAVNPAGCPEGSFVGSAVAHTPLLPVPLEGPAILVSHGGAAFPNLELVLQGDGVVVDLTGNTEITKGITYSKFETAPDAPFSSFELKLPEGPHSILGSYIPTGGYSFCGLKKIVTTTKTVTKKVKGNGLPPFSRTLERLGRKTLARRFKCREPGRRIHRSSVVKRSS